MIRRSAESSRSPLWLWPSVSAALPGGAALLIVPVRALAGHVDAAYGDRSGETRSI